MQQKLLVLIMCWKNFGPVKEMYRVCSFSVHVQIHVNCEFLCENKQYWPDDIIFYRFLTLVAAYNSSFVTVPASTDPRLPDCLSGSLSWEWERWSLWPGRLWSSSWSHHWSPHPSSMYPASSSPTVTPRPPSASAARPAATGGQTRGRIWSRSTSTRTMRATTLL